MGQMCPLARAKAGRTLLPQLRLSLLHRANDHIANTSIGQPVEARTEAVRLDDVQRARTAVVGAVDDGTGRETERDSVFVA